MATNVIDIFGGQQPPMPPGLPPGPPEEQEEVFRILHEMTEDEKDDHREACMKKFDESYAFMSTLYPSMIKNYKQYRSIAEPMKDKLGKNITDRANLFIPYTWGIVESEIPRLAGRLPRVRAFPRKLEDKDKVQTVQDLIYYSLDRMQFIKLQTLWIRQFAIYGWSPLFYFWREEERTVLERVRDQMGDRLVRRRKKLWDDFDAVVLDVFDCFLQPGVMDIANGDWFIHREWVSTRDIKSRVEAGVYYPETLKWLADNPKGQNPDREGSGRRERDDLVGLLSAIGDTAFGQHELLYFLEDDKVSVILDRNCLVQVGDNPHPLQRKPILNCNLLELPSEPIGIGTVEALAGLNDKLNMLSNARVDNISLLINKVVVAKRFAQTDYHNIKMTPGNIILTDDVESIKFLDVPDVAQSSEREILVTKEEMQFTSGISDFIVGVKSGSRLSDTATGVSTIVREANARFALKLAALEAGPLREFVLALHAYNMTYMPEEKVIHVLGPKGYVIQKVTIDDILCECDFIVEPGSSVPLDQLTRREALVSLLDRVVPLAQIVDVQKYLAEVFDAHDIRNYEDFFLNKQESSGVTNDARLAEAENIALMQGQDVTLRGNDRTHIEVHSSAMNEAAKYGPEAEAAIMDHLNAHMMREQAMMQASMTAGQQTMFGGSGVSIFGGGGSAGGSQPTGQSGMGGASQVPGPVQGDNPEQPV